MTRPQAQLPRSNEARRDTHSTSRRRSNPQTPPPLVGLIVGGLVGWDADRAAQIQRAIE